MEKYSLIVIGGGPAGLFGALRAAGNGRKILILEKMLRPGRKLLLSGSGQCNITHAEETASFLSHYGDNGRFLRAALMNFRSRALISFFTERGLPLMTEPGGKVFPVSRKASDILNLLIKECRPPPSTFDAGTRLWTSRPGTGVSDPDGSRDVLDRSIGYCDRRHHLSGHGFDRRRVCFRPKPGASRDGNEPGARRGDRSGLSICGPGRDFFFERDHLSLPRRPEDQTAPRRPAVDPFRPFRAWNSRFIPLYPPGRYSHGYPSSRGSIIRKWRRPCSTASPPTETPGSGRPSRRIICRNGSSNKLLTLAGIDHDLTGAHLSREHRSALIELLLRCPFVVGGLGGVHEAMVTRGGVSLAEINPKTMESRLLPRLYFIGEVLDIDGDTGGYNLQAAFSTAALAARRIMERYSESA